jgi:dienelactone hydrolase
MTDQDLLLTDPTLTFGSGVIGVCDICGQRQAVITLLKERYKLCVLDFLNKSWINSKTTPGNPLPLYRSERVWFDAPSMPSGKAQAIVLAPTKVTRHPAVLVVSDVYGLTTMVLDASLRFARAGYEVLMPDLPRVDAVSPADHLAMRVDVAFRGGVRVGSPRFRRLLEVYADSLRYLRGRPMVDPQKIAVFGASYGGTLAAAVAGGDRGLAAVALAFPAPLQPAEYLRLVNAPVFFLAGDRDPKAARARAQWEQVAPHRSTSIEFESIAGRGPLFLAREHRNYDLASAETSWTRILGFLQEKLLPPPPKPPAPPVMKSIPPPEGNAPSAPVAARTVPAPAPAAAPATVPSAPPAPAA